MSLAASSRGARGGVVPPANDERNQEAIRRIRMRDQQLKAIEDATVAYKTRTADVKAARSKYEKAIKELATRTEDGEVADRRARYEHEVSQLNMELENLKGAHQAEVDQLKAELIVLDKFEQEVERTQKSWKQVQRSRLEGVPGGSTLRTSMMRPKMKKKESLQEEIEKIKEQLGGKSYSNMTHSEVAALQGLQKICDCNHTGAVEYTDWSQIVSRLVAGSDGVSAEEADKMLWGCGIDTDMTQPVKGNELGRFWSLFNSAYASAKAYAEAVRQEQELFEEDKQALRSKKAEADKAAKRKMDLEVRFRRWIDEWAAKKGNATSKPIEEVTASEQIRKLEKERSDMRSQWAKTAVVLTRQEKRMLRAATKTNTMDDHLRASVSNSLFTTASSSAFTPFNALGASPGKKSRDFSPLQEPSFIPPSPPKVEASRGGRNFRAGSPRQVDSPRRAPKVKTETQQEREERDVEEYETGKCDLATELELMDAVKHAFLRLSFEKPLSELDDEGRAVHEGFFTAVTLGSGSFTMKHLERLLELYSRCGVDFEDVDHVWRAVVGAREGEALDLINFFVVGGKLQYEVRTRANFDSLSQKAKKREIVEKLNADLPLTADEKSFIRGEQSRIKFVKDMREIAAEKLIYSNYAITPHNPKVKAFSTGSKKAATGRREEHTSNEGASSRAVVATPKHDADAPDFVEERSVVRQGSRMTSNTPRREQLVRHCVESTRNSERSPRQISKAGLASYDADACDLLQEMERRVFGRDSWQASTSWGSTLEV